MSRSAAQLGACTGLPAPGLPAPGSNEVSTEALCHCCHLHTPTCNCCNMATRCPHIMPLAACSKQADVQAEVAATGSAMRTSQCSALTYAAAPVTRHARHLTSAPAPSWPAACPASPPALALPHAPVLADCKCTIECTTPVPSFQPLPPHSLPSTRQHHTPPTIPPHPAPAGTTCTAAPTHCSTAAATPCSWLAHGEPSPAQEDHSPCSALHSPCTAPTQPLHRPCTASVQRLSRPR